MHLQTLDVAGHVAVGEPSAGVAGGYLSVDRKYRCEVIGDDSAAVLAMQIINPLRIVTGANYCKSWV